MSVVYLQPYTYLQPALLLTLVFSPTYTEKDEGWTKDHRRMIGVSSGYYTRRIPAGRAQHRRRYAAAREQAGLMYKVGEFTGSRVKE